MGIGRAGLCGEGVLCSLEIFRRRWQGAKVAFKSGTFPLSSVLVLSQFGICRKQKKPFSS